MHERPELSQVPDLALAERIVASLHGRSIATAESCTAGRIATTIAAVPNAAQFFRGALEAYHKDTKRGLLKVTSGTVLSERAAAQMADSVCALLGADISIATSGVAGDVEVDGVEPGTVFVATSVDGQIETGIHRYQGSPEEVCEAARHDALDSLAQRMSA